MVDLWITERVFFNIEGTGKVGIMVPRETFARELEELQNQIEEMSRLVQETYEELMKAVSCKDEEAIHTIMKRDEKFYDTKKRIEGQCLRVITKQQPIATDLRLVSSVLKIVTDIERVGDHAGDIGELMLRIGLKPVSEYSVHLNGMFTASMELFAASVKAYLEEDMEESRKVIKADDIVDELFNKVKKDIISALKEESRNADEYIDMMVLAKYLEKIGDHAENIAKWSIFRGEGRMV